MARPDFPKSLKELRARFRIEDECRAMLLPNDIVSETEESQKTDAEIAVILMGEDPEFYALFTEPMIRAFEPQKIEHRRHWKRRTLATNAVVVKKESEGYIRFAVTSIDP
jgi:hypothetical protein